MNARAACRLETLGFAEVYRYAPGKADWRAAGLPTEGTAALAPRAADAARREVPTCSLTATVRDAQAAAAEIGENYCVVVDDDRVVLGRLRGDAFGGGEELVATVMEEGPTTTRADDDLAALVDRLRDRGVATILVTDPDGRLIGVLHREDGERVLGQQR